MLKYILNLIEEIATKAWTDSKVIFDKITQMELSHTSLNSLSPIYSESVEIYHLKLNGSSTLGGGLDSGMAQAKRPSSVCDMIAKSSKYRNSNKNNSCSSDRRFIQRSIVLPTSTIGKNGDSDVKIGNSSSILISYHDEDSNELSIDGLESTPVDIWIKRKDSAPKPFFSAVNMSLLTDSFSYQTINLDQINSSIHIHMKPENIDIIDNSNSSSQGNYIGYLILLKFGESVVLNSQEKIYDLWDIFCPYLSSSVKLIIFIPRSKNENILCYNF